MTGLVKTLSSCVEWFGWNVSWGGFNIMIERSFLLSWSNFLQGRTVQPLSSQCGKWGRLGVQARAWNPGCVCSLSAPSFSVCYLYSQLWLVLCDSGTPFLSSPEGYPLVDWARLGGERKGTEPSALGSKLDFVLTLLLAATLLKHMPSYLQRWTIWPTREPLRDSEE